MRYTDHDLCVIYDRSSGYCHVCQKKLAFRNYAKLGARAAWEIDHSRAQAMGGTHGLNNLLPACISCNRQKGLRTARAVRALNGCARAPLSRQARRVAKRWNALGGAVIGALPGALFGPVGVIVGAVLGAKIGHDGNPDLD